MAWGVPKTRGERAPRLTAQRLAERGLTLIELIVTIAIILLLLAVGTIGLTSIRGADVSATASVVSGAMRYVSSLAVSDNKTYRLILDLDSRRYWTEAAAETDRCARLVPDNADPPKVETGDEGAPVADAEPVAPKMVVGVNGAAIAVAPTPNFKKEEAELLQGDFQPDTNVTGVLTSHHETAQTSGKVAIYFYPTGYSERAFVWIGEKNDERTGEPWIADLTLELHPLGRVTRHDKVVPESEFEHIAEDLE